MGLPSIRQRLQRLVVACVVPAWVVALLTATAAYQRERDDRIASTELRARLLRNQVERELALSIGVLQTLGTSPSIDDRDRKRFHQQARDALTYSRADNIVWFDAPRRSVLSAAHPLEESGRTLGHDHFPEVFTTGKPAVSDVFTGEVSKQVQVAVGAPVLRDGRVVGRLDMVFTPARFARILAQQGFPPGWTLAIVDSQGNIAARNRDPERFVGKPASGPLRAQLLKHTEGHFDGLTSDGIKVVGCFSKSETYGWAAVVAMPLDELHGGLIERLGIISGVGLLALLAGLALARVLARNIADPVQALVGPALAIGRGEAAVLPRPGLKETAEVAAALQQAQALLLDRQQSRRAAESALQQSQSRLRMALDLSRIGTWQLDPATGTIEGSRGFDECLGGDVPSRSWTLDALLARVHPDDRARVAEGIGSVARDDADARLRTECRVQWPDGSVHWLALQAASPAQPGEAGQVIGVVSDITPDRQAEAARLQQVQLEADHRQAQEASRLKSEFLANMSHELRTPLNAVIGFAEILRTSLLPPDSPKRDEYLGHIAAGGRHLLQLINDVLDLAKVESGKFDFFPEPVDLPALTAEVVGVLQGEAERKGLTLETEADDTLSGLELDPSRLKQVLYNYLSNALKFTPAGGRVVLRTRPEGPDHFRVEVEDTGVGISEADQRLLFAPFQQVNSGAMRRHGGTGLGLALTRQLAELQGGTAGVRSAPGVGSTFHVVLPRRPADHPGLAGGAGTPGAAA